mgnify:CR=1 FL=1
MRKNICVSLLFFMGCFARWNGIKPYRLEGDVRLPEKGGISMFDYLEAFVDGLLHRGN